MQPYALYGLLPHYSLGLDIVVAYAKALNSSTLTSSLLWVERAAMHSFLGIYSIRTRRCGLRGRQKQSAPHERIWTLSTRSTTGEALSYGVDL